MSHCASSKFGTGFQTTIETDDLCAGAILPDAEWLLPPAELRAPSEVSPPEGEAPNGCGVSNSVSKPPVSAISLPPIATGYLASRSASLELALTDSMLQGRGDERFGPLPGDS